MIVLVIEDKNLVDKMAKEVANLIVTPQDLLLMRHNFISRIKLKTLGYWNKEWKSTALLSK